MKIIIFFVALMILFAPALAQEVLPLEEMQSKFNETRSLKSIPSFADLDRRSGVMHLHASPSYIGSSLAYLMKGSDRLLYGLNLNLMTTGTVSNTLNGFYASEGFSQTTMLIPFWLTFKLRLYQDPGSTVSPYIVSGLGPTLGLRLTNRSNFTNILSDVESSIGGGAFVGAGFDYLWTMEWAVSMDVRYNVIRFNDPIGLRDEYDGLSFYVGFIRAFGL